MTHPLRFWTSIPLWQRIIAALLLGGGVGFAVGPQVAVIKPLGDFFLALIRMLAIPMIFTTLAAGVAALGDPARLGRMGGRAVAVFLGTVAVAVLIGVAIAVVMQPGLGLSIQGLTPPAPATPPTAVERLLGLVPQNPFASLAEGEILQVLVFALLVGVGCVLAGDKADPLKRVLEAGSEVMLRIAGMVMELAPFGVFALIAWVAGTYGLAAIAPLAVLGAGVYLGCLIHGVVVYGALLKLNGLPVVPFFRGISGALAVAYATASSNATMPVTLKCVEENLGVDKSTASFVVSLGATINMDGTALYLAMAAIFGAQAFGVTLMPGDYLAIMLTSILAAVGAAGVPGAGLIMMSIVLGQVGVPLETIAIVAGVDRLLDMARTTVNVAGDAVTSVLVAKWDGQLDEGVYRDATPA